MTAHATAGWIFLMLIVVGIVGWIVTYAYYEYTYRHRYRRDITMKPGLWRPNERRRVR